MTLKFIFAILIFLISCKEPETKLPSDSKYAEDTKLMINICEKFAEESDANKLHTAAVNTQYARVVACFDYFGECNLYGQYLSMVVRNSADGSISSEERSEMRKLLKELQQTVNEGKAKLQAASAK